MANDAAGILHDHAALAQKGASFAPASGHIDGLKGEDKVSRDVGARVPDQVDFQASWLSLIPGDDLHGHSCLDLRRPGG